MLMERFPARHLRLVAFALVFACALAFSPVASAQEAPKPTLAFSGDVGLVLLYVKAEATTSFEEMLTKFKDGVAKMEAPEVKQMAAGLKFLKAPEGPAPAGATLYILMADPAVKDVEVPGSSRSSTRCTRPRRRRCSTSGRPPSTRRRRSSSRTWSSR